MEKCEFCGKSVYPLEKLRVSDRSYHRWCFRCSTCNLKLSLKTFHSVQGRPYCNRCYKDSSVNRISKSQTKEQKSPAERPRASSRHNGANALNPKLDLEPKGHQRRASNISTTSPFRKETCEKCGQVVFHMERTEAFGKIYHRWCLKCTTCSSKLTSRSCFEIDKKPYCKTHYESISRIKRSIKKHQEISKEAEVEKDEVELEEEPKAISVKKVQRSTSLINSDKSTQFGFAEIKDDLATDNNLDPAPINEHDSMMRAETVIGVTNLRKAASKPFKMPARRTEKKKDPVIVKEVKESSLSEDVDSKKHNSEEKIGELPELDFPETKENKSKDEKVNVAAPEENEKSVDEKSSKEKIEEIVKRSAKKESEPEPEPESKPESESGGDSEPEPEPELNSKPESESECDSEPVPELKSKPESESEGDSEPEPEPKPKPELKEEVMSEEEIVESDSSELLDIVESEASDFDDQAKPDLPDIESKAKEITEVDSSDEEDVAPSISESDSEDDYKPRRYVSSDSEDYVEDDKPLGKKDKKSGLDGSNDAKEVSDESSDESDAENVIAKFKGAEKPSKRDIKRKKIVDEIYDTELSYLNSLEYLKDAYIAPIYKGSFYEGDNHILGIEEVELLFSNILKIYKKHSENIGRWKERIDEWSVQQKIGDIPSEMADWLPELYTVYVNNFDGSLKLLSSLTESNQRFVRFLENAFSEENTMSRQHITSFLIMPVQRIPRYVLLLEDLLKNTSKEHLDFKNISESLEKVKETAELIDASKAKHESAQKKLEIMHKLNRKKDHFIKGSFFIEGTITVDKKKNLSAYLFSDMLLLCIKKKKNRMKIYRSIDLEFAAVQETPEVENGFQLNSQVDFIRVVTLTKDEKNKWIRCISDAIEANATLSE